MGKIGETRQTRSSSIIYTAADHPGSSKSSWWCGHRSSNESNCLRAESYHEGEGFAFLSLSSSLKIKKDMHMFLGLAPRKLQLDHIASLDSFMTQQFVAIT